MPYRVYDKKRKNWVKNNIYLNPDGELVESKKSLFGNKLTFVDQNRYVYQKYIELEDKNGTPIYIGDYIKAKVTNDEIITGMVTYASELSSYIILCFNIDKFYTLGTDICDRIEVIGNVFEEPKQQNKRYE